MTRRRSNRTAFAPANSPIEVWLSQHGFTMSTVEDGIGLWQGTGDLSRAGSLPANWSVQRLLDRYYLVTSADSADRDRVIQVFCTAISSGYEGAVHVERNIENIRRLVEYLERCGLPTDRPRVLDFGCGPGLALQVETAWTPIGFDQSVAMRNRARAAGMMVLDERELVSAEEFHGVFASYVLHMESGEWLLWLAASRLVEGGVFVANFHKHRGGDWADRILAAAGCEPEFVDDEHSDDHGRVVVYRRSSKISVPCALPIACAGEAIRRLVDKQLLPTFNVAGKPWILIDDVADMSRWKLRIGGRDLFGTVVGESDGIELEANDGTAIELPAEWPLSAHVSTFALIREISRLLARSKMCAGSDTAARVTGGVTLRTGDSAVLRHAATYVARNEALSSDTSIAFANSAYYMGAKQALGTFLVESISGALSNEGAVVDLMCGAGSASKAFSIAWPVVAADPMAFCCTLTGSLGAGHSEEEARRILTTVEPIASVHQLELAKLVGPLMQKEQEFFVERLRQDLVDEYKSFVAATPRYPEGGRLRGWRPTEEITARVHNPGIHPYCLFTAYYAGVYFGIRQCVEIDSIRYGISQLPSGDQSLALAALIAACSRLGSGYANQFAQPLALTTQNVKRVLEQRAQSVFQEFSVRLLALGTASEIAPRTISTIESPWEHALERAASELCSDDVLVYVDAPYRRDEYARYYHVLETLVRYAYPPIAGKGRCPARGTLGYFQSPFFTRSESKFTKEVGRILGAILDLGWACAWSHSDIGIARLERVLGLLDDRQFTVSLTAAPYQYKGQGRRRGKAVTEHVAILQQP